MREAPLIMDDGFTDLIDDALGFFAELSADNSKAFFEPRKAFYAERIKTPAEMLGEVLAQDLGRRCGTALTPKLFRIHRDVRFSKDKTPYNAHLHLMWRPAAETAPVWFFGAAPSYLILGVGLMGLKGPSLDRYRAFVDRDGDRLAEAMATAAGSVGATLSDWGPEPLKRVPKPYAPDHKQGDLLRRKALALSAPFEADWRRAGLVAQLTRLAEGLFPVWEVLSTSADP